MLPDFNDRGYLPPGRYRLTITQSAEAFVHAELFQASTTRSHVWQGLQEYLYQFIHLVPHQATFALSTISRSRSSAACLFRQMM
ncbi:DUF6932 family protein [Kitasatospora hibisci]|uniref:DUF6932 family protein n=1 Tax=Kitasatospora hibisci TaxID=3369522 RepID=UPI0037541ECC